MYVLALIVGILGFVIIGFGKMASNPTSKAVVAFSGGILCLLSAVLFFVNIFLIMGS